MSIHITHEYERLTRIRFRFDEADIKRALVVAAREFCKRTDGEWRLDFINDSEMVAELIFECSVAEKAPPKVEAPCAPS